MTFMIAAAGTGGHVYPGLAVGEALVHRGIPRDHVGFVGGDRLEREVYPARGFRFMDVELVGLQRRMTLDNLRIPAVVLRARSEIARMIGDLEVEVVLGMGGYVTIPAGLAARSRRVPFFNAEQNASAGLANRVSARWAQATFVSFPDTTGLPRGRWVGNPVREPFWAFDRDALRSQALTRYGLDDELPTLGVFGGSLGAQAINDAIATVVLDWSGDVTQVVHLTGEAHHDTLSRKSASESVVWRRVAFEERMDLFFAACDLVVARAGGAVAELTATGTPSVLIPGRFGSGGHQNENARFLARSGAAVVIDETDVAGLAEVIDGLLGDADRLAGMRIGAAAIAKPRAALTIADAMIEAVK